MRCAERPLFESRGAAAFFQFIGYLLPNAAGIVLSSMYPNDIVAVYAYTAVWPPGQASSRRLSTCRGPRSPRLPV